MSEEEAELSPDHQVLALRVDHSGKVLIPFEDECELGSWKVGNKYPPPRYQAPTVIPQGSATKTAPVQDLANYYPRVASGLVDLSRITRGSDGWFSVNANICQQFGVGESCFPSQSIKAAFKGIDGYTGQTAVAAKRAAIINFAKAELATRSRYQQT